MKCFDSQNIAARALGIVLTLAGFAVVGGLVSESYAQEARQAPNMEELRKNRPIQQRTLIMTYTDRIPGDWVKPSGTKKLKPTRE